MDALRGFLESFRLPGESPVVERILETLSQHWMVKREREREREREGERERERKRECVRGM